MVMRRPLTSLLLLAALTAAPALARPGGMWGSGFGYGGFGLRALAFGQPGIAA